MAEVLVAFRVMPKSIDVDLNTVEERINSSISPDRIEKTPIAFGIVAFNVIKIIPDDGKALQEVEEKLRGIDGVGEVEVVEVTRSL